MYCEPTNHNFELIKNGIKCSKCSKVKSISNFGFDDRTIWRFSDISCWLLAYILNNKIKSNIFLYRDKTCIYHIAILYNNKIIDINGIHLIDDFKYMCETFILQTLNFNIFHGFINIEYPKVEDCYVEIATQNDIELILHHKIPIGKTIKENLDYKLANECAEKIISYL